MGSCDGHVLVVLVYKCELMFGSARDEDGDGDNFCLVLNCEIRLTTSSFQPRSVLSISRFML